MRLLKFSQGLGRSLIQFLKTKLVLDHFPVFFSDEKITTAQNSYSSLS